MRKPRILLLRCRRYVMSGITRSMPSMPSSGNMRPASTTMMSSPTSTASMFFPISPTPPSGITRNGAFALAKERYLLHRFLLRLCRRRRRKEQRECRKVGVERLAQGWLMERRGRVVDGKDHQPVGGLARPAMDARDRFAWEELPHRVAAERDDHAGLQDLEVAAEPHVTGGDLFRERVAVLGGPVPNHVGDEDLAAVEPDAREELVEELPRGAHEGLSLHVLVVARRLAEEEDPGVPGAIPGYRLARASMQRAGGTRADLIGDQPERRERGVLHRGDYAAAAGFRGACRAR